MKIIATSGLIFAAIVGTQFVTSAAQNAYTYEKLMESGKYDAAAEVDKLVRAKYYKCQVTLYDVFKDGLAALYFMS